MSRKVYVVESSTVKTKLGFKVFSSFKAAERFVSMFPDIRHRIIPCELLSNLCF